MSSLINHAQSFIQSDQLQTDVNVALSNLLSDIQNKTCKWVSSDWYTKIHNVITFNQSFLVIILDI